MHQNAAPLSTTTLSSPSLSLANFDYDSDVSVPQPRAVEESGSMLPPGAITRAVRHIDTASPFISPDMREDLATQSDIAELRAMIQNEFSDLKKQILEPNPPVPVSPPSVSVPETAFADTLRAELAVQMAKVSVLEEENRKLRSEKQGLRVELERAKNGDATLTQLDAANAELRRLYVERQGLWDERADLWK
ncbi:hypothetical protein RhiJN_23552 [Ceratobasidium sp. AG-Ba]|nr:hypothetical protein RhiJN_23552 [Ceratobasidium sp. AG-Ba]